MTESIRIGFSCQAKEWVGHIPAKVNAQVLQDAAEDRRGAQQRLAQEFPGLPIFEEEQILGNCIA
jgi:hypothetical protein